MSKNKFLIAVSGGPDSMALLDMAYKRGYELYVVSVNYHKRATCNRDELLLRTYCDQRGIPCYIKHSYQYEGNFQDYARKVRYDFFLKIAKLLNIHKILMAHNLDDFLETLLMQVKRGSKSEFYGIRAISKYGSLSIYRPLLSFSKDSLERYCLLNDIPYGLDESNYSLIYQRNYLRHKVLKRYPYQIKLDLYNKVNQINNDIYKLYENYRLNYQKDSYDINEFKKIKNKKLFLRTKLFYDLSEDYLEEIIRQLLNADSFILSIKNKVIVSDRNIISFLNDIDYEYTLYNLNKIDSPYFKMVDKADNKHACKVYEDDFPLTIRNYQKGDKIKLRYGTKKLSSFFKDHKINKARRLSYPVVLNKDGDIIFVPGLGANISHFDTKANLFMLE